MQFLVLFLFCFCLCDALPPVGKDVLRHCFVVVVIDALQHGAIGEFDGYLAAEHVFPPKSLYSSPVVIYELAEALQPQSDFGNTGEAAGYIEIMNV